MASIQPTVHDTVTSQTSNTSTSADDTITSAAPPTTTTTSQDYNNNTTSTETEAQLQAEISNGTASIFSKDPEAQRRGSDILSRTPAPDVTAASQGATEQLSGSDAPTSSVGQQNAPGRAGSIGENALGALGYGGSQVERPKAEQGLGEKIMNFMGT